MNASKETSLEERVAHLEKQLSTKEKKSPTDQKSNHIILIICTQDLDQVLPALVIATNAATLGIKVTIFFTIWGINVIKKKRILAKKSFTEKLLSILTPRSNKHLPMSNLNLFGIGPMLLKHMLKEHKIPSLDELLELCRELDIRFTACELTMNLFGITEKELLEHAKCTGVTSIISEAATANCTLFI